MKINPSKKPSIAVVGGTGKEGKLLAYNLAKAGYKVFIGSRAPEKAKEIELELLKKLEGTGCLEGLGNIEATKRSEIIVLSVPYSAHKALLEELRPTLQGKLLVDITVPLNKKEITKIYVPLAGSAAQESAQILGEGVEICAAFQNIAYENLVHIDKADCDVLVTGTSNAARQKTLELVDAIGLRGWDAGPLENSVVVEGLTSVLININKLYKCKYAGIKITGVDVAPPKSE